MEVSEDVGLENKEGVVIEEIETEEEDSNPHISVHVINDLASKGYQTMRVTVYVKTKPLHILIDLGSTHNFLDTKMAKKLWCKVKEIRLMKVDVANGNSLACVAMCKGLTWTLQGSKFTTDVLLLPLGNCDMVLGVQWLQTLGEIKWDFKHLIMEFRVKGKKHVIKGGIAQVELKIVTVKQVDKILPYSAKCSLIQLCSLQTVEDSKYHCYINRVTLVTEDKVPEPVNQLLHKYAFLFQEPT